MKKKCNLVTLVLSILFYSSAQAQDCVNYYDSLWAPCLKYEAKFYRNYYRDGDSGYRVSDMYIEDNQLEMTGFLTDTTKFAKRYGPFVYYYKSGNKSSEGAYVNNKQHGTWIYYYKWGTISRKCQYKDGKRSGMQYNYFANGQLKREELDDLDTAVSGKCYDSTGKEVPFVPYEVMPRPLFDMAAYLSENLVYPKDMRKRGKSGRVYVKFIVLEDGSISKDAVIVNPEEDKYAFEMEALRVVVNMPRWRPGALEGKPVKVYYTQPISFRLE